MWPRLTVCMLIACLAAQVSAGEESKPRTQSTGKAAGTPSKPKPAKPAKPATAKQTPSKPAASATAGQQPPARSKSTPGKQEADRGAAANAPEPARTEDKPTTAAADCKVQAATETGPVSYTVPIPTPGSRQLVSQCLMPAKQAVALAARGALLIVDTRSEPEFERYRIPGSMNIPAAFVKTKAFLRGHAFVLANAGQTSAALEETCEALRAAGFKQAAVLRGGLSGWKKAQGVVEGDLLAQRELDRMQPVEYAEEGAYGDWLVASVADLPAQELTKFFPKAMPLPNAKDDTKFITDLDAAMIKRARKGLDLKVLIVDDDGSRIERLESRLPAALAGQVFFLEGGVAGYRRFWSEQAAIWAALDRGPKQPRCGA
jgi:rhodanese-related sulfurtransferase